MKSVLIVTTEHIPEKKYEVIGEVFGMTTQSKNLIRNLGAGLKNIVGGEIKDYTKMLEESRRVAVERLRKNAAKMGADAVVMMRFDSSAIGQDMQAVAAYGTAVKFVAYEN
ncbi:heavy metal-binding domain-containing protein [Liquorilactobacillus sicerae]|uniref:heavy metal-binding domain-containing protein n=1 Tax=Liquorilactobacillus sicerae TaxID=1416943 RepID=UPI002480CB40|nr:heavy metal-binding domain-containing protein [Liquorilactobacillus sicerae]